MIPYVISIVDDEETIRDSLELTLSEFYDIQCYADGESFLEDLDRNLPDLVLLDIGLPVMSGIEVLEKVKETHSELPVIMITAFEDIKMVIRSMKNGAFDFILKPLNPDILELTIEKALKSIALQKEVRLLQEKFLKENLPVFIGKSKEIEDVMDFIHLVAKSTDTPVMIRGETGTGKELIARAIHARSPLFKGPFVAVNCSALPDELLESELFGYEPGAFTGASTKGKKGFIQAAENGTLFLDEVADLSPAGQAKLLRFLENKEFYKVGGTKKYSLPVRIVSATNKQLEKLVEEKKFRKDLYFRLCVVKAQIPSLNDRKEDILPLARYFLYQYNIKFDKHLAGLSPETETALLTHNFTGNVRELKNIIERAVLIEKDQILGRDSLGLGPSDIGILQENHPKALTGDQTESISFDENGIDLKATLKAIEKQYLSQALKKANGNESQAARLLGLNHHTFRYKWKQYKKR